MHGNQLPEYRRGVTGSVDCRERRYIAQKLNNASILQRKVKVLCTDPSKKEGSPAMPGIVKIEQHQRPNSPAHIVNKISKITSGSKASDLFIKSNRLSMNRSECMDRAKPEEQIQQLPMISMTS